MNSEYRQRENDPSRRVTPADQEQLEELAFHSAKIMGELREGAQWFKIYGHLARLRGIINWAFKDSQIDPRAFVQADGSKIDAQVERLLEKEDFFEETPDHLPPEWREPNG